MSPTFREVVALWVTPDYEDVFRGKKPTPYIDHDAIDFDRLAKFVGDHFKCGERVKLRFPNDTIDETTIRRRMEKDPDSAPCLDFAEVLLVKTKGSRHPIPIRAAWSGLHAWKDRSHAPPPVGLMFVVEGAFEAVQIWVQQMCARLGLRAADPLVIYGLREAEESDYQGWLTEGLAAELELTFGTPYGRECILTPSAFDTPPGGWASILDR